MFVQKQDFGGRTYDETVGSVVVRVAEMASRFEPEPLSGRWHRLHGV